MIRLFLLVGMLLAGCSRYPEYHETLTFDPSQCQESYAWQGHLSTRGLFERTITCQKTDVPPLVSVDEIR